MLRKRLLRLRRADVSPVVSPPRRFETWGRTHSVVPARWEHPTNEAEVQLAVRRAAADGLVLRVVGAGHSWSDAAITGGVLVSLDGLDRLLSVDLDRGTATAQAGMRLSAFNTALAEAGAGLPIVGSVSKQSLAGLLSTATHGSSLVHGNLSSFIVAMRLVTADGEVLVLEEGDPRLPAARVSFGALGVITEVTLRVQRAFRVAETQVPMTFDAAVRALDTLPSEVEWGKFWWLPHTDDALIFRGERTTEASTFSKGGRWVETHLLNLAAFRGVIELGGVAPALIPRLNRVVAAAHFRPKRTVGRSDLVLSLAMPPRHRESEWAVPVEAGPELLRRLKDVIERRRFRVNFILEARFVKADTNWMSPAYGRDSMQIGAYVGKSPDCQAYYDAMAELAADYGGRPHWGKDGAFTADLLRARYPQCDAFSALVLAMDPKGVFANAFVRRVMRETGHGA
jgi:FAD-linked oxidoreductase